MPKIPEYKQQYEQSPVKAPRYYVDPNMARHVYGDGLMRAGSDLEKLHGHLLAQAEREDKTLIQQRLAEARSELTTAQQDAIRSGKAADPKWVEEFRSTVGERLSGITEGLKTTAASDVARVYQTQLAEHFATASIQDHSVAVGQVQKATFVRALEMDRNTVLNDPTQFGLVQSQHMAILNDPQGQYAMIPQKDRLVLAQQVNKGLALSAVQGTIRNISADEALRQLNSGQWDQYLDADNKAALLTSADTHKKARQSDAMRAARDRAFLQRQADDAKSLELVQKMASPNGVSNEDILKAGIHSHQRLVNLVNLNNSRALDQSVNFQSDPKVIDALQRRIYADDADPSKLTSPDDILRASRDRQINYKDTERMLKMLDRERTKGGGRPAHEAALQAKKAFMRHPSAGFPGMAETAYYNWRKDFEDRAEELRANGEDPSILWNPKAKEYMLSAERLNTYMAGSFTGRHAAVTGTPTAGAVVQRGGKAFKFNGGDAKDPKNWSEVKIAPQIPEDDGSTIQDIDGG